MKIKASFVVVFFAFAVSASAGTDYPGYDPEFRAFDTILKIFYNYDRS